MRHREPFTALAIAAFSLASYHDGAVWASGVMAGIAGMMLGEYVLERIDAKEKSHNHK